MEKKSEVESDVTQVMKNIAIGYDIPEDFYGNSFPNETKFMKGAAQKSATKEAYDFWINEIKELGNIAAKNYVKAEGMEYYHENKYVYGVSLRKNCKNVILFVKIDDCVKWSKMEERANEVKYICSFDRACFFMDNEKTVEDAEVFKREVQ